MTDNKIYVGQKLKLILQTTIDLTGNDSLFIKYKTPSGTLGSVTAQCDDLLVGDIYYTFNDSAGETELNEAGIWKFWSFATYDTGDTPYIPGQTVEVMILNQGE